MGRLMLALVGLGLAWILVLPAGARDDDPTRWRKDQWMSREFAAPPFVRRSRRTIVVRPVIKVFSVAHAESGPETVTAPAPARPRLITVGQAPAPVRAAAGSRRSPCTGVLVITWTEGGAVRSCRSGGSATATR